MQPEELYICCPLPPPLIAATVVIGNLPRNHNLRSTRHLSWVMMQMCQTCMPNHIPLFFFVHVIANLPFHVFTILVCMQHCAECHVASCVHLFCLRADGQQDLPRNTMFLKPQMDMLQPGESHDMQQWLMMTKIASEIVAQLASRVPAAGGLIILELPDSVATSRSHDAILSCYENCQGRCRTWHPWIYHWFKT